MSRRDERKATGRASGRREAEATSRGASAARPGRPRTPPAARVDARLVKPRVRAHLRDSVSALASALPARGGSSDEPSRAEVPIEGAPRVADGEVLVMVADAHRVLGARVRAGARLPEGWGAAALTLLVEGLRSSLTEATRGAAPAITIDASSELPAADAAALARGGFDTRPLAPAEDPITRTAAEYAALIADALPAAEVARLLGVEDSRVRQRLTGARPTLYGLKLSGSWRVPRFQFDGPRLVPGIAAVVPRLDRTLHPVAVARWFTTPTVELTPPAAPGSAKAAAKDDDEPRPLSPRAWLLAGYPPDAVAALAETLGAE